MVNNASIRLLKLAVVACCVLATSTSYADEFGSGVNTFEIEFVTIGNPCNNDDTNGIGSVHYTYRMGKFEISRDLITKANNEGGLGITLADMTDSGGNGVNRPARISWFEAARFVNWLNTSTGHAPAYKFALQPGDAGYSANDANQLWGLGDPEYDVYNLFRNSQAKYFLPSDNEWYKAAYHKNDGVTGNYWVYPTGSDTAPTAVAGGTLAGTAVYEQTYEQGPADVSLAGGLSPYGTMGQGGNVWEWVESEDDLVNDSVLSDRGLRGGSWLVLNSNWLRSSSRWREGPMGSSGFRVVSIGEPTPVVPTSPIGTFSTDFDNLTVGAPGSPICDGWRFYHTNVAGSPETDYFGDAPQGPQISNLKDLGNGNLVLDVYSDYENMQPNPALTNNVFQERTFTAADAALGSTYTFRFQVSEAEVPFGVADQPGTSATTGAFIRAFDGSFNLLAEATVDTTTAPRYFVQEIISLSLDPGWNTGGIIQFGFTSTRDGTSIYVLNTSHYYDNVSFVVLGDANDDGVLNNLDISAFFLAAINPTLYAAMYPDVDPNSVHDMNGDGSFNNLDFASFVAALTGQ